MDVAAGRAAWVVGSLLAAFVALSLVVGVIASGLVIPVGAVAAAAVSAGQRVFDTLPTALNASAPPQTSVLTAADGTPIAHFYDQNRTSVTLARISPWLQKAMVAIEDDRFYEHGAVDARGLVRAAVSDLRGSPTQGASTLTEQYVKNVLVDNAVQAGDPAGAAAAVARTATRKLRELRLAVAVEHRLSKPQILEDYLNIVYFDRQTYGAQAAALRYFGVPASRLDLGQAATLAGMVQAPGAYDPISHPAAARARRNVVLARMLGQGMITPAQEAAAARAPEVVKGSALPNGCGGAGDNGFFCAYVVQSLLTSKAYAVLGATPASREHALMTGGLRIRTSLDSRAQDGAVHAVFGEVPARDPSGLAASAVTVEPGSGAVLAMAEDRAFSSTAGVGRTSVNYGTDAALGGSRGFQTGSSFKPFTLAAWLASGHGLTETVDATKRPFAFSDFTACGHRLVGRQPYLPGNSEGTETGRMSVLDATANSVNVAYVDMETQLDLCDVATTAQRLGVHLAAPQAVCSAAPTTTLPSCAPSLTLGVADIAPLTMAAAYAAFASGGIYCVPLPVTSIVRAAPEGGAAQEVAAYRPSCHRALSADVAAGVSGALTQVLARGTAASVGPLQPWPSAGKTGTTDGPYDTWFVGYTAQRSTAVWVGDPGHRSHGDFTRRQLTGIRVAGHYYPVVYGASIAAPIWKSAMDTAMHGLPPRALGPPGPQLPTP